MTSGILSGLAASAPDHPSEEQDIQGDILANITRRDNQAEGAEQEVQDVLASLDTGVEDTPSDQVDIASVLSGVEAVEETAEPEDEDLTSLLADLDTPQDAETVSVDDVLSGLETPDDSTAEEDIDLDALLGDLDTPDDAVETSADDVLGSLGAVEEAADEEELDLDALLGDLDAPDDVVETSADDVLGSLGAVDDAADEEELDLDALLGSLDAPEDVSEPAIADAAADVTEGAASAPEDDLDLDALLGDVDADGGESGFDAQPDDGDFDLDSLLAETEQQDAESALDPDALLGGEPEADEQEASLAEDTANTVANDTGDDDLDDLLGGLDLGEADTDDLDDLDALFGDLDAEVDTEEADDLDDLDALLADLGDDDGSDDAGLDALLGDLDDGDAPTDDESSQRKPELAYGTISADRPEPQKLTRKRFRIAIFGDFTGRAAKGQLDTGEALAERKPIVLDPDTIDDVIESFATELVLPIGKEGAGISVKLGEIDDLHPDELYDNVALFSELVSLRKQLQSGVTKDHAMKTLSGWAEAHGTPARAPKSRSGGNAVPADKRLSDFQSLIGDTTNSLRTVSPVEDMMARIVGPHIRALPDPNLGAMQEAVDLALSDAMRLVLHHPEFQSVEAQWRSLDLIARSVEVDDTLDVMVYDVSAEELAADLAAQEDLSQTGFVRLLTEDPMDEETGRGAYSALVGLYTFEETPPHAELLARFARVAAHVDAPFLAAITPGFWGTEKAERPKVVAEAWDTLSGMAEAGHLGLLTPRFLLRRPYGARSEPIDPFDFEEFTQAEGLRGMLWGNPVVLAAILMAKSFRENGPSLQLGSIMSLGDMPFHYVNDRFGDQVALPCTERNVDLEKIAIAKERGFMPIASVRGRDEIRLTSFNSLRGDTLLGPWTGEPAPEPSPPDPRPSKPAAAEGGDTGDSDDLDFDFDLDDASGDDDDLDALLSGFGDDDTDLDGDLDADLEALLNDL
ncbi:type VI secretion system contractile sheath domain-containing protein [Phaeobacter sp. B1627]|uniref:type VI secretion system contractile sheath domain-containing protein n=1 Tax=Phaeobacter sp. B1627 TaxID=2583809 RepID=UPI002102AC14|nr:type VI secretion system contractile sheath large subunit [Phaeobacter sp. B1627]